MHHLAAIDGERGGALAARRRGWKQWDEDVAGGLESLLWWVIMPIVCVVGLFYGTQDLPHAWAARQGYGTRGTFTAETLICGRRSCQWHGTFTSDDGTVHRDEVVFTTGSPDLVQGQTAPALDTGDRVAV